MPKKILVVEDDLDMVELLCFNLKKEGSALGTAIDGIEALKKARSIQPDLILLDLMLPELDGFTVCELLRRDSKTASIPIIILTAVSSQLSRFSASKCSVSWTGTIRKYSLLVCELSKEPGIFTTISAR